MGRYSTYAGLVDQLGGWRNRFHTFHSLFSSGQQFDGNPILAPRGVVAYFSSAREMKAFLESSTHLFESNLPVRTRVSSSCLNGFQCLQVQEANVDAIFNHDDLSQRYYADKYTTTITATATITLARVYVG